MPKADEQAITEKEQENSSCVYGIQGGLEGLRTGVVPQQPGKRILRREGSSKKRPNTCECWLQKHHYGGQGDDTDSRDRQVWGKLS